MNRHLKALALAALAVFAMAAVSASAAQAAPKFTSEIEKTTLHGVQSTKNVFTPEGGFGSVECTGATFEGTSTGVKNGTVFETATVTVHPTYTGCTAFGLNATVTTTGCNYVLKAAGTVEVECEAGKVISINVGALGCTLTIGAQTPGTPTVDYTNNGKVGKEADVLVTATVGGVAYTRTAGGFGCPATGKATYTGSVTTKGYTSAAHTTQVGIKWDKE
jgi:hypothetical protein